MARLRSVVQLELSTGAIEVERKTTPAYADCLGCAGGEPTLPILKSCADPIYEDSTGPTSPTKCGEVASEN